MNVLDHRPGPGDIPQFYARYLELVPDGNVLDLLAAQVENTAALLESIGEAGADYRYAEGKWSVKEVVGHMIDVERIFATRALRFARGDRTPLPGFEQNAYVAASDFGRLPLSTLVAELRTVRASTIALFRNLSDVALSRRGTASGGEFLAGGVAWIIAGHEAHHFGILEDRYLPGAGGREGD